MAIESASRPPARARRRRLVHFTLLSVGSVGIALLAAALVVPYSLYRQIGDAHVDLDVLPDRPAKSAAATDAIDVAVLGTVDTRCVSLMVFHINSSRRDAAFVSVPNSPVCGPPGRPMDINDPPRIAQQLERTSRVHLDHLAILDWDAIAAMDAIADGVEVELDGPAYVPWPNTNPTLTPDNLRDFVANPISSPEQEPARIRRQQLVLQNVLRSSLHQEMRKDPRDLYHFLDAVTGHLEVDADWSLIGLSELAVSLRNMRSNEITFHTADPSSAAFLWASVREDMVGG